jgi:hypothetical protein
MCISAAAPNRGSERDGAGPDLLAADGHPGGRLQVGGRQGTQNE